MSCLLCQSRDPTLPKGVHLALPSSRGEGNLQAIQAHLPYSVWEAEVQGDEVSLQVSLRSVCPV